MTPEEQLADQLARTQRIADGWSRNPTPTPRVKVYRAADVQDDPGSTLYERWTAPAEMPVEDDPRPVRYAVARTVGMTITLATLIVLGLAFTSQLGWWSDVLIVIISAGFLNLGAAAGEGWLRLREQNR